MLKKKINWTSARLGKQDGPQEKYSGFFIDWKLNMNLSFSVQPKMATIIIEHIYKKHRITEIIMLQYLACIRTHLLHFTQL